MTDPVERYLDHRGRLVVESVVTPHKASPWRTTPVLRMDGAGARAARRAMRSDAPEDDLSNRAFLEEKPWTFGSHETQ